MQPIYLDFRPRFMPFDFLIGIIFKAILYIIIIHFYIILQYTSCSWLTASAVTVINGLVLSVKDILFLNFSNLIFLYVEYFNQYNQNKKYKHNLNQK